VREDFEMQICGTDGATPEWLVAWVAGSARRRHEERKAAARLLRDIGVSHAEVERVARG
jgi:hypothetical protein